ncbi:hypothetical protein EDB85DRAFT_1889167 [Lactarius pseudohatsudake]|nr:hypothetical protein EDB85DRAFT_1889167 [Lactarius pseudohatsudake]
MGTRPARRPSLKYSGLKANFLPSLTGLTIKPSTPALRFAKTVLLWGGTIMTEWKVLRVVIWPISSSLAPESNSGNAGEDSAPGTGTPRPESVFSVASLAPPRSYYGNTSARAAGAHTCSGYPCRALCAVQHHEITIGERPQPAKGDMWLNELRCQVTGDSLNITIGVRVAQGNYHRRSPRNVPYPHPATPIQPANPPSPFSPLSSLATILVGVLTLATSIK